MPEIVEARENFKMWGQLNTIQSEGEDSSPTTLKLSSQKTLRQVYKESSKPQSNLTIDISDENKDFEPQGFFISNNDNYVGVIGQSEIWIIDSRHGNKIHAQDLPKFYSDDVRKSLRAQQKEMRDSFDNTRTYTMGEDTSLTQQHPTGPSVVKKTTTKIDVGTDSEDSSFASDSNTNSLSSASRHLEGGRDR